MAEAQQPTVSGNVMFYEKPVPLNREQHTGYGVTPVSKPFEFMRKSHFLPLTAAEFGAAAASYPIIFAGEDRSPLAVMGIRTEENLFVTDGQFHTDYYMPAFARRYPFVLASDQGNDRFVVCVDEKASCVTNKNPGQPFFTGEDTSTFTKEAFGFLQNFERDRQATTAMINELKDLDLFESKDMHFQGQNADGSPGERQKIADYFAISEEKLRNLPADKLKSLAERGILAVVYAHLISLSNWQRLVNMTLRLANEEQAAKA
ncbi:peptidase [Algimonas arctica]|uniref:Peptidase n=1 Tax=Algimonas arctica TaxID=1479486 RepID=A0A8J3CQR8_9PROT|nr:SapC family protein [Algimonas arctica]GHA88421.1 peptidase [Algimonas arctica]